MYFSFNCLLINDEYFVRTKSRGITKELQGWSICILIYGYLFGCLLAYLFKCWNLGQKVYLIKSVMEDFIQKMWILFLAFSFYFGSCSGKRPLPQNHLSDLTVRIRWTERCLNKLSHAVGTLNPIFAKMVKLQSSISLNWNLSRDEMTAEIICVISITVYQHNFVCQKYAWKLDSC